MPTNKTPNYQLSQWERADKVLMDDFNADNAKIDAALKAQTDALSAEISARKSLLAGLEKRTVPRVLKSVALTEESRGVGLSFSDLDFSKIWMMILLADVKATGAYSVYIRGGGNENTGGTSYSSTLIFFPMYRGDLHTTGLNVGQSYPGFQVSAPFCEASVALTVSSSESLLPGTTVTLYGIG